VKSDEIWHHYAGEAVELHVVSEAGEHVVRRVGARLDAGEEPQAVVPAGVWQAAKPAGKGWTLCGCTVAPGFDFADFELPTPEAFAARFPDAAKAFR
jgi:predicted cupin superfamily sugar epimerase